MFKKNLPVFITGLILHAFTSVALAQASSYSPEQVEQMRQLAEQGESFAQSALGVLYIEGDSVPQNYAEAHKWLERAALQNEALAQFQLGVLHYRGQGVPQNDAEALRWFGKSCAVGLSEGCTMYSKIKLP
ncbi:MAG: tetratricopeptide repeat protein [Paenalcaligenes sp.]